MTFDEYKRGVFIGGIIAGVLSAVPFVGMLNIICCLWILVGGVIGVYLAKSDTGKTVEYGEGALIGLFCGLIAAVIAIIINIIFTIVGFDVYTMLFRKLAEIVPEMPPLPEGDLPLRDRLVDSIPGMLITPIFFCGFGALGGVIGTAIFGKKK